MTKIALLPIIQTGSKTGIGNMKDVLIVEVVLGEQSAVEKRSGG